VRRPTTRTARLDRHFGPHLVGAGAEVTMGLGIIGLTGAIVVAVIILRLAGIL